MGIRPVLIWTSIAIVTASLLVVIASRQTKGDSLSDLFPDPVQRTHANLGNTANQINQFLKETKRLPRTLSELDSIEADRQFRLDGWGSEFVYVPRGSEFSLSSAGPDLTQGTSDDIVFKRSQ
jgi:hypothetical protein